jgi:anthranilate phosphoribosyltransferase
MLSLMQLRGPTADELTGGATAMRRHMVKVQPPDGVAVVDTCGTGGWGSGFVNISTAAGLVAAAAGRSRGMVVAKHGNRSVTSASGSADVLEALGVTLATDPATLTRCLDEAGFCFCFARAHHPAMKHAAPVRQELGFRTVFNLLGPLCNPAGATRQLLGVASAQLGPLMVKTLQGLGSEAAMVVHSTLPDGRSMGELSNMTTGHVHELKDNQVQRHAIDPESLGLPLGIPRSITVGSATDSASMIRSMLAGEHGPVRDVVCLNAAAALVVGGAAGQLRAGLDLAQQAIDDGDAQRVLDAVVKITAG